jgi:hypothetical protein
MFKQSTRDLSTNEQYNSKSEFIASPVMIHPVRMTATATRTLSHDHIIHPLSNSGLTDQKPARRI